MQNKKETIIKLLKINSIIFIKWLVIDLIWFIAFMFVYTNAKQYISLTYGYNMNAKMLNAVFETSMINAGLVAGAFVLAGQQIIKNGLPKFKTKDYIVNGTNNKTNL